MKTEINNFCKEYGITKDQFFGKTLIEESLYLNTLTTIPKGFNPTMGDSLYLDSLTFIPKGFNPKIKGSLYLNSLTFIPDNFNLTVNGNLDLHSLLFISDNFNPTVAGYLDLSSLITIPDNFNLTIGKNLDLRNLIFIPNNFNPTIGGDLYLNSLDSISDNFNPTVEGYIVLKTKTIHCNTLVKNKALFWQNGKYIKVDGIFTEVISHKGNLYKVKELNSSKEFYLVTNGEEAWAHGDTKKEAKLDLIFKITTKCKDDYKDLTLDSNLTFEDGINCYRAITGACSLGIKDFIKNRLEKKKSNYSISEIIKLTAEEYGNQKFIEFFKRKDDEY